MSSSIPAFSVFSAISELFVTAGVLVIVFRNRRGLRFSLAIFLAVALFEAFVNVMYMSMRASQAASGAHPIAPGLRIFFALHGMLSLVAYLVFVILGVFAYQDQKNGRFFFRERPAVTWSFLAVWLVSVASGEALFVLRYLV